MSLSPGQQIGDYRILEELGAGGMGKVFKVQNVISDRLEAMKVLLPDLGSDAGLAERFLREIKVQASLEHPNIARLHTAMRADNQLLMLMEFVEGRTVESFFSPEHPMPLDHAVWYCMQVLGALDYAHARGIVHRDIKPSNMMLTAQGEIKLLDFGIARVVNDPTLTQTRQTVGSLFYMSPEQINGSPVDARSDLYSLGVSLYQMVTGRKPFDGTSDFSIMAAHMQQQAIAPIQLDPRMPQILNDVILKSISKSADSRFQSAAEFRGALETVLATIQGQTPAPVAAAPIQPPPPQPGGSNGLAWKLGLVAFLVVAFASAAILWIKFRPTTAVPTAINTPADPIVTPPPTVTPDPTPVVTNTPPANKPAEIIPTPAKTAPSKPVETAPPPPQTVVATQPAPSAPAPTPVVEPSAPKVNVVAVAELRTRRVRIESRLEACKTALANLRETLGAQGLKPRGDLSTMLQTIASEAQEGDAEVKAGNYDAARQHFDAAEQTLRRVERSFNL